MPVPSEERVKEAYQCIAKNLVRLRGKRSQLDVANACGVSQNAIYLIEHGRSTIPLSLFVKLCATLNCKSTDLLSGAHKSVIHPFA